MLLTVGPDNDTGFRKHLEELSKIMGKYPAKFILVGERGHENTLPIIKKYSPTLTIFGGRNWIKRNSGILSKIPGKKGVLYCSPLAQAEISGEEISNLVVYLDWLDKHNIDYLFVGSKYLADRLNRPDVIYLPAPSISDLKHKVIKNYPKINSVCILNDKAAHKNILNSIAGISLSKRTEKFLVNGLSTDYLNLVQRFGLIKKLKNTDFLPKSDYFKTVEKVKLSVHLSFSEGFSYSVFEFLIRGTPVLVSTAVPWVKIPTLIVNNPQDHREIARKIDNILGMSATEYYSLSEKGRRQAEKAIEENNNICKLVLRRILRV